MLKSADLHLRTALERLAVPGILIGHRFISPGDEYALLPQEAVAAWPEKARRRSGAAEAPPRELVTTIATPAERESLHAYLYGGRLLFAAKEAVYKAVAGLDGIFLEHHDVEIDFAKHGAAVRNGRTVALRFCVSQRLLALAFIRR
jgi:hypothetical protein